MICVTIVDKHKPDREKTADYFTSNNGYKVIGEGQDPYDAIELAKRMPDVFICDPYGIEPDGPGLIPIVKHISPGSAVIIYTRANDEGHLLNSLLYKGVRSYLFKDDDMRKLSVAVNIVCSGGIYIDPSVTARFLKAIPRKHREAQPDNRPNTLLPRNITRAEMRILHCMGHGWNNHEIAARIGMAEGSVRNKVSSLMHKLNMRSRSELAVFAVKHGITS